MGLFSKEACTFCGKEVGMLGRSKLATKEFICNDCKRKTNYFARMDYTSKEDAQWMMDNMAQEEADFEASYDGAESRFDSAERSFNTWDLGSLRVHYRRNTRTGGFQIKLNDMSRYASIPVLYFDTMIPYEFASENSNLAEIRRMDIIDTSANYVTVDEDKDSEGKVTSCTVVIPYNDKCIREIRLKNDVRDANDVETFYDFAQRLNQDRINWLNRAAFDLDRKNRMQVRNLGDTAMEVLKAATKGESVEEALKKGIETANDIEEGKVKQGFFGKLFKK